MNPLDKDPLKPADNSDPWAPKPEKSVMRQSIGNINKRWGLSFNRINIRRALVIIFLLAQCYGGFMVGEYLDEAGEMSQGAIAFAVIFIWLGVFAEGLWFMEVASEMKRVEKSRKT